jgi:hypothetical protein
LNQLHWYQTLPLHKLKIFKQQQQLQQLLEELLKNRHWQQQHQCSKQ